MGIQSQSYSQQDLRLTEEQAAGNCHVLNPRHVRIKKLLQKKYICRIRFGDHFREHFNSSLHSSQMSLLELVQNG